MPNNLIDPQYSIPGQSSGQPTAQSASMGATFAPSFMSKVFTCFGLAVGVSALGAYLGLNYFVEYFISYPYLTYGLFILEIGLILTSGFWSKKEPINIVLFALFALITGLTIVPILAYLTLSASGAGILIKALAATGLMFGGSAIFGLTTHRNLSGLGGFLIMALIGMIVVSIIGIFLPWNNSFEMIFSGIGVIIFSAFVMYDVQRLKSYPEDMYINAAMQLYLDIFNLFLYILRLLMALNRR